MSPLNSKYVFIAAGVAACILGASSVALGADARADKVAAASTVTGSAQHAANSVRVSYRDLDLASATGSRVLEERITVAARKVCAADDIRDLRAVAAEGACQREAVSNALADVHSAHPGAQYALNLARR